MAGGDARRTRTILTRRRVVRDDAPDQTVEYSRNRAADGAPWGIDKPLEKLSRAAPGRYCQLQPQPLLVDGIARGFDRCALLRLCGLRHLGHRRLARDRDVEVRCQRGVLVVRADLVGNDVQARHHPVGRDIVARALPVA